MSILRIQDDKVMLVVRMQSHAYSHVKIKHIPTAELFAESCLADFAAMIDANPADVSGYWATFYYDRFVADCAALA